MEKTKKCERCGVKVYPNQRKCSKCVDIILHGSVKKARESAKRNFKLLGL